MRRLPLRRRWAGAVADGATDLLFSSAALRREFLSWIPPVPRAKVAGRCHASAMGIEPPPDAGPRDALRRRLGFERFTVLSVGRLVAIKGLRHAIDATAGEDWDLVLAGDGPERRRLEDHAADTGAPTRFLGARTGLAKAELLAAADAFVVPSIELSSGRTEGTPTAVLEAAAAGLPIVASATGGIAEIFEHERSALLVRPGDPIALRASLRRLRNDPALRRRLERHGREVGRSFEWSELAPRIEELLLP
jgi:glycosyltransferase involved in cell wall biosynthesis